MKKPVKVIERLEAKERELRRSLHQALSFSECAEDEYEQTLYESQANKLQHEIDAVVEQLDALYEYV